MTKSSSNTFKLTGLIRVSILALVLILGPLGQFASAGSMASDDSRFLDNKDGTISDTKTGLMWMKKDSYLHSGHWLNWKQAHEYVEQLNQEAFAQYIDWQLPSTQELKSLYEPDMTSGSQAGSEMKIHTHPIFEKDGSGSLWSGEENGRYNAFGVVFNTGSIFNSSKKSRSRKATRAVRVNNQ